MTDKTLLIVDDEKWIRHKLVHHFDWKRFGIDRLLEAADGEEALALLRSERVDVVITDMDMPFMNGADMMQVIQREFPSMPVVVLSGYSDFDMVHGALVGGAVEYLLKPVQETQLYAVMEKVTGAARQDETAEDEDGYSLNRLRDYIDAHFAEDLSLDELSRRFSLSQSYLSRSFKRIFGVNLSTYITTRRMEEAARLLDRGHLSISQVASGIGYADYAYFSNLFRKHFGCSPRDYQKKKRNDKIL